MGRPERPVGAGDGALADLARHLRELREAVGRPTYRELSSRAHYSAPTLARAAAGQWLPSLHVALAYTAACAADLERTRYLWHLASHEATLGERDAGAAAAPRTNLPPALQGFIGRDRETRTLDAWLGEQPEPGSARLAALTGPAGIGKTSLALRFAHRNRPRFPDGALYADLRGFDPAGAPVDPADQLGIFLRLLELPPTQIPLDLAGRVALFHAALAGRRVLLVLDNAADTNQVRPLLPTEPGCATLVTSRNRLAELTIRFGARRVPLEPMSDRDALRLLHRHIGSARAQAAPQAVARMSAVCGGLPLALRLAAERAAVSADERLDAIADRLAAEQQRLDVLGSVADDHTAVRAVLSWTYRILGPDTARLFGLVGLCPLADLSVDAAARLAGEPTGRTRVLLDLLADVHLVESGRPDYYRLHDLVRVYAREQAAQHQAGGEQPSALRLLAWYLHMADRADGLLVPRRRHLEVSLPEPDDGFAPPADYNAALDWCERERTNLVAAVRWAATLGQHTIAWQLAATLIGYFLVRKHWGDWIDTHRTGLDAARAAGDLTGQAWMLAGLGAAHGDLRQYAEAIACLREALEIRTALHDASGRAVTLLNLGFALWEHGQREESVECLQRSLVAYAEAGDERGSAMTLNNLGVAEVELGRHDDALRHLGQALELFRATGNRYGEGSVLDSLGQAHLALHQDERAEQHLLDALRVRRGAGDRHGTAVTLAQLAEHAMRTDAPEAALRYLDEAHTIFGELNDPRAADVNARAAKLREG